MSSSSTSLTRWSLLALLGGLLLGLAGHLSNLPAFQTVGALAGLVGELWVALLQMITLPLALALTLAAIGTAAAGTVGKIGSRAAILFLVALGLMGMFALAVVSGILSGMTVDPAAVAAMRGTHPITPPPPIAAQAMLVLVRWTLVVTPLGVFALTFMIALKTGASLAGLLGGYLALHAGVTLLCTALLYPVTAVLGRVPVARFARAVLPAQIVAVSTRSSVASLPAMVEGGRQHLG